MPGGDNDLFKSEDMFSQTVCGPIDDAHTAFADSFVNDVTAVYRF